MDIRDEKGVVDKNTFHFGFFDNFRFYNRFRCSLNNFLRIEVNKRKKEMKTY